jgi:hypothetical protein
VIGLPRIQKLQVAGYALYPGTPERPGIDLEFKPGLTLILGANGLGKTTLITILYRLLAGPTDIPGMVSGADFGNRRLEVRPLSRVEGRIFAERVVDDADNATATLWFALGDASIEVTRRLHDLEIVGLRLVGEPHLAAEEPTYQGIVREHANVPTFADWIVILRHLEFYFEDRRALVWDASAQRQLLRLLFLDNETSALQATKEREILSLDSSVRNQQYSIGREERRAARTELNVGSAAEVRQQLQILQRVQEDELELLNDVNDQLVTLEADRQRARINALTAEQAHESAMRAVERQQLQAIRAAFPGASQTAAYLVGQILASEICLVCGTQVPELAASLEERVLNHACVICNSPLGESREQGKRPTRALAKALKDLQTAETQATVSSGERDAAESAYDDLVMKITELTSRTATRSADIDRLIRRLPPGDKALHQQRSYLATMRGRLASDRELLDRLRSEFAGFASHMNAEVSARKDEIKAAFESYASGFLIEGCELIWAPQKMRLGETGGLIEFPAFQLNMTGASFKSPIRRTGPGQVSESQREFIDLAFRMALMETGSIGGGTLVIDAPESSLDAVFVSRAAVVLTRFGHPDSANRLVVTSNLIDGDLIPHLLHQAAIKSAKNRRVLDLLEVAAPTAAVAELRSQYENVRHRLFVRARELR